MRHNRMNKDEEGACDDGKPNVNTLLLERRLANHTTTNTTDCKTNPVHVLQSMLGLDNNPK